MEKNGGVRKGAWTKEEDTLLKNCIQKFGEGKWHKVPSRAGLNRCRKSCRLRWLNYLRPNLKRGCFTKDEVDLVLRLQKLLGNRWSLIAGRLPGRTANDVKNFWNTHILKKKTMDTEENTIIKPRPLTFTKSSEEVNKTNKKNSSPSPSPFPSQPPPPSPSPSLPKADDGNNIVQFPLMDNVPIFMQSPVFPPEQINQKVTEFSGLLDGDVWDLTIFD